MMTDYEIIHIIVALALWLLTWELFLGQYFYTRSEKEMMKMARGEGNQYIIRTLISIIVTLFIMGIVFCKIIKYSF